MVKKTFKILLGVVSAILTVGLLTIRPIDRLPLERKDFYEDMQEKLEQFSVDNPNGDTLMAGWHSINITPDQAVNLAGYGRRGPVKQVHDSLFAKVLVLDNGGMKLALISLDLIVFPKRLSENLTQALQEGLLPVDGIFFGAIHTHNGYGHWERAPAIQAAFGRYRESLLTDMQEKIQIALQLAVENQRPARTGFLKVAAPGYVINRLDTENGKKDAEVRSLVVEQLGGDKAIITSYSAHPVVLDTDILELSRDYPGYLTDHLEKDGSFDMAMFFAGMVGSHTVAPMPVKNYVKADSIGRGLSRLIIQKSGDITYYDNHDLACENLDVELPKPQLRISKRAAVRSWLFKLLIGPLKGNIRLVRIGNMLMLGTPGDFSGEIAVNSDFDSLAASQSLDLMITSFNGNFIGYITEDYHYDISTSEEVTLMNWTGPYMGAYFSWIIKNMISKSSD
jgi:hypothetical protein